MVSRRRRRGIPPGRASGLAPRSMIIVFASLDLRPAFAQPNIRCATRRDDDEGEEFSGPLFCNLGKKMRAAGSRPSSSSQERLWETSNNPEAAQC
jgi:hypothetical protein